MKRLAFFCLICLTALSACSKEGSSITSITGEIIDIEKDNLKITLSDIQQNNVVSVIITEEKTLTEDRDSRTIEAKELTLLEK